MKTDVGQIRVFIRDRIDPCDDFPEDTSSRLFSQLDEYALGTSSALQHSWQTCVNLLV